jgi:hypothetical protein
MHHGSILHLLKRTRLNAGLPLIIRQQVLPIKKSFTIKSFSNKLLTILVSVFFSAFAFSNELSNVLTNEQANAPADELVNELTNEQSNQTISEQKDDKSTESAKPVSSDNPQSKPPGIKLMPYEARYDILDGSDPVGTADRTLTLSDNTWRLEQSTSIKRWYYKYEFTESSEFIIQNETPLPQQYASITKRSFKDNRIIKSQFNWDKNIETGSRNGDTWTLELAKPVVDHLSYQIALRLKADQQRRKETFRVSYKGELDTYQFINDGEHTIKTELGDIKTILWTQKPNNKHDKIMLIWLAPELQYMPVQMAQYRNGKAEGTIRLKYLNWL